ncbi:T6SS immunity protein Tdi1 domain-containing protein [Marinospirillum alkalitolerans]
MLSTGSNQEQEDEEPLFKRALEKLIPLAENEMYAFIPVICLGRGSGC